MIYLEHMNQVALFNWARVMRIRDAPDIEPGSFIADYLFSIPNGGIRSPREAARLKAEGVKAGVVDIFLPIKRNGFSGMWLEMKAPKKKPTKKQAQWLEKMRKAGYAADWADNWVTASRMIQDYLGG